VEGEEEGEIDEVGYCEAVSSGAVGVPEDYGRVEVIGGGCSGNGRSCRWQVVYRRKRASRARY